MTCAERPPRPHQRTKVHAKKEKASLRRVRSGHLARTREQKYTSKKKKQVYDVCGAPISPTPENKKYTSKRKSKFMTCAERPSRPRQRTKTHAKKEKASLRRVRSTHLPQASVPRPRQSAHPAPKPASPVAQAPVGSKSPPRCKSPNPRKNFSHIRGIFGIIYE